VRQKFQHGIVRVIYFNYYRSRNTHAEIFNLKGGKTRKIFKFYSSDHHI